MKISFVTEQSLNTVWQERLTELTGQDLVIFGFNGMGLVSYKKELSGETEYFHDLARLSKQLSCVVVSGCDTDTYGVFRHSGVIADKGKILGVSDMAHSVDESEFVAGGNYRVYETSIGNIGLIIGEDLFFTESSKTLSLCNADFIICLFKKQENVMPQVVLRSLSYINGVPMALCSDGYSMLSDIRGNVAFATSQQHFSAELKIEKDYHEIGTRRRGLYREGLVY